MRFWLREIAGWLLVGLGLFLFYIVLAITLTDRPWLITAGPLTLIGIIVFRGGIHLLKVAVAARICMKAPVMAARTPAPLDQPKGNSQPLEW
ncbi:MAG: hypothetical protein L0Y71_01555 [Gemmataceae bacterium]|nr:hypothetical protein [Gemmataceae bacterium]